MSSHAGFVAGEKIRGLFALAAVPAQLLITDGHLRSSIIRKAVDSRGRPIPSYTYPAIDLVSTVDWSSKDILEFGGGQSTLWWSERARSVTTLEHDPNWFRYITSQLVGRENATCILEENLVAYARWPAGRTYDVVVIDGGDRAKCATTAVDVVARDGLVIVDDSEGYWGPEGTYPIIELFNASAFRRVDLYGYAPGVRRKHCTSLFFRAETTIFASLDAPRRPYRR